MSGWVLAGIGACAGACLLRRGVRGHRSSRLLGSALSLTARTPLARYWTGLHARFYRDTGGRLLRHWFGSPVLVLETTGRRSGRRRSTPITYLPHGDGWVVMPVNAGSDRTPGWWLNLLAAGEGVAHVAGRRHRVRPRLARGDEREELWQAYVRQAPTLLHYRRLTDRDIPVIVLEEVAPER